MTLLKTHALSCGYGGSALVEGVELELSARDIRLIVGPNGAGKSTLLKTLCGTLPPLAGRVAVDDRDLAGLADRERARMVSMLLQIQPLDPGLTVEELVRLGRTPHLGPWGHLSRRDLESVERAMELCRIADHRGTPLSRMSGGERQRARLAMVLAQEAPLLLLDEPTNHLDVEHRYMLHGIVEEVRETRGCAVVMVSHSLEDARRFGGGAILVSGGRARQFDAGDHDSLREAIRKISGVPADWVY